MGDEEKLARSRGDAPRSVGRTVVMKVVLVVAVMYMFFSVYVWQKNGVAWGHGLSDHTIQEDDLVGIDLPDSALDTKVPLDVYIMSKCPDAKDCLIDLVVPTMANISNLIDFRLEYIGETHGDDIECKHGPEECEGNVIELCAAEEYPNPKLSLGFSTCLTNDYDKIPSETLVQSCAAAHGINLNRIKSCFDKDGGTHGWKLLQQSIARTQAVNVTKSCTVRLHNEVRCIRDGGEWKNCKKGFTPEDLIRDVRRAAQRLATPPPAPEEPLIP